MNGKVGNVVMRQGPSPLLMCGQTRQSGSRVRGTAFLIRFGAARKKKPRPGGARPGLGLHGDAESDGTDVAVLRHYG